MFKLEKRKIIKDPMFIGAFAAPVIAAIIFFVLAIAGYERTRFHNDVYHFIINSIGWVLWEITFPHFLWEWIQSKFLHYPSLPYELCCSVAVLLWYAQVGFWSGVFYKTIRKYYPNTNARLALIIFVGAILIFIGLINHR